MRQESGKDPAAEGVFNNIGLRRASHKSPRTIVANMRCRISTLRERGEHVSLNPDVRERATKIKLLLMDCDGVLTNGKLFHFPDAQGNMVETKGFDSQDGIALQWMQWKGLKTGVISGRESLATVERARQTKINYVYQGHIEKIPILEKIMIEGGFTADEVAYIGDDLTDVVVMHRVGLAVAVANARPEVKREAHYLTEAAGGSGAVREVIELILDARGFWREILDKYEVLPH
jgi:3-deoxy-D-manno-octulosonate 8-phosphate phosphatase (KDO 8-P phosphatase)